MSVVGLGCNMFGPKLDLQATQAVIGAALDAGITHFDTAESYGGGTSEEFIGATLGARRDDVVIATKFQVRPKGEPYEPGVLARRIREGCETSLRRLRTDHIDLYYQHFPDPDAPVDETLQAFDDLVEQGKVRHVASSNFDADSLRHAADVADRLGVTPFCGTQIEWNLLNRAVEDAVVPAARELGVGIIPYFPLASGMLTGKYRRGQELPKGSRLESMDYFKTVLTDENFDRVERLTAFADEHGHTILELAVAWLAAQPGVASVICGATSPAQVEANAQAAGWRLGEADLAALDALL
jgi:aryl-alcohol dehydrogenase-like predicted oxidoreductase